MRHDTVNTINTLTSDYAQSLAKLRDQLQADLNQVNEQLRICEEFAGIRLPRNGAAIVGGTLRTASTASAGQAGASKAAVNLGKAEYSDDGRPKVPSVLTEEDAKRLAHAIGAN